MRQLLHFSCQKTCLPLHEEYVHNSMLFLNSLIKKKENSNTQFSFVHPNICKLKNILNVDSITEGSHDIAAYMILVNY